jgi:D-tyrosyl-tRNA(Tyr) deacylase
MRAVVQRVSHARVTVDRRIVAEIDRGLLVYLGIAADDVEGDLAWMVDKVLGLRIFADETGQMNLGPGDVSAGVLAVSQFTLMGDARRGRRPSFIAAMRPESALPVFQDFVRRIAQAGVLTACGEFGADMQVSSINDGPVTILLDSRKVF